MNIVVLSGAGVSAESGIKTFRDSDGLWEGNDVMAVASIEGFERDPELVLRFYNSRRRELDNVSPNEAHILLAELEKVHNVSIITQNVDDLHERAGSSDVLHLHGELKKMRSVLSVYKKYDYTEDIKFGDLCENGGQLRPDIVWFGEDVPLIERASKILFNADIFLIIGTSLQVYPAAGLIDYVPSDVPVYIIDPVPFQNSHNYHTIRDIASSGMRKFIEMISE